MSGNVATSFEKFVRPLRSLMRGSIPVLFFLTPLVFAPFTSEAFEMNKQVVMVVLVFLMAFGLLGSIVAERQAVLRGGVFVPAVLLLFVLGMLLSTTVSRAGVESWLGYGGQEYVSFLTTIAGVVFFAVLVYGGDAKLVRQSVVALLISSGLVSVLMLLSLAGVHISPFAFTRVIGFNTIGNVNALISWLMPVSLAGLGLFLVDKDGDEAVIPTGLRGAGVRLLIGFLNVVTVFLLVMVDFWTLWAAYVVGLVALLFFTFLEPRQFPDIRRFVFPCVLFSIALIFLFIKTPLNIKVAPLITPSVALSSEIAAKTLSENTTAFLFGSGPGSFDLDFEKYRPVNMNETAYWNTRFDRAQMHSLTLLATTGVVGVVSFTMIILTVAALGLGRLMRHRQEAAWGTGYALFAGWLSMVAVLALNPMNMSLVVLFWGLSGLVAAAAVGQGRHLYFRDAPRAALALTSGFAVFVVIGLLTLVSIGSRHAAEIAFARAVKLDAMGASVDEFAGQMELAVKRQPWNAVFQRNLAAVYLGQTGMVLQEVLQDGELRIEDAQRLNAIAEASVRAVDRATALGEFDSANWATSGLIYRELLSFVPNAQNYSAIAYTRAIGLEPNNPSHRTELGRVYLAVADRAQEIQEIEEIDEAAKEIAETNEQENLQTAAEHFENAIRLKPDYAPAHYYLAATYERQGNLEDAAERLSALTQVQPNDAGLSFQLAIIYLKMKDYALAEVELERILAIHPNYSNAMWYLAAIKANDGDSRVALDLLQKLETLNPENEAIKTSIDNLVAGLEAPADPGPLTTEDSAELSPTTESITNL